VIGRLILIEVVRDTDISQSDILVERNVEHVAIFVRSAVITTLWRLNLSCFKQDSYRSNHLLPVRTYFECLHHSGLNSFQLKYANEWTFEQLGSCLNVGSRRMQRDGTHGRDEKSIKILFG
jgi:hypothetical protein